MPDALRIREANEQDAGAIAAIYAPYVLKTAITFEYTPPDAAEFAGRLRRIAGFFPFLAAENSAGLIGYAYASPFHERAAYAWAAETSVYVRMDSRRQGVGAAAVQRLGGGFAASGHSEFECLHRLPSGRPRSLSHAGQRGFPQAAGVSPRRHPSPVRL